MELERFSHGIPTARLVWDATTLASFCLDPLQYYWRYVEGYNSIEPSINLLWGTAWDKTSEQYWLARGAGRPREEALHSAIAFAIDHANKVELDVVAASSGKDAKKKNLSTLIRSIVWYDDEFGADEYEAATAEKTQHVKRLPIMSGFGEPYYLVGNFDQVMRDTTNGKLVVFERKSTGSTISSSFWQRYDPSVQINTYAMMAHDRYSKEGLSNIVVEACQTAVGFSRFSRHECFRTPQQHDHWLKVVCFWIKFAEQIAAFGDWSVAMNLAGQMWESSMRNIQRRSPAMWTGLLDAAMEKQELWDPLGDH